MDRVRLSELQSLLSGALGARDLLLKKEGESGFYKFNPSLLELDEDYITPSGNNVVPLDSETVLLNGKHPIFIDSPLPNATRRRSSYNSYKPKLFQPMNEPRSKVKVHIEQAYNNSSRSSSRSRKSSKSGSSKGKKLSSRMFYLPTQRKKSKRRSGSAKLAMKNHSVLSSSSHNSDSKTKMSSSYRPRMKRRSSFCVRHNDQNSSTTTMSSSSSATSSYFTKRQRRFSFGTYKKRKLRMYDLKKSLKNHQPGNETFISETPSTTIRNNRKSKVPSTSKSIMKEVCDIIRDTEKIENDLNKKFSNRSKSRHASTQTQIIDHHHGMNESSSIVASDLVNEWIRSIPVISRWNERRRPKMEESTSQTTNLIEEDEKMVQADLRPSESFIIQEQLLKNLKVVNNVRLKTYTEEGTPISPENVNVIRSKQVGVDSVVLHANISKNYGSGVPSLDPIVPKYYEVIANESVFLGRRDWDIESNPKMICLNDNREEVLEYLLDLRKKSVTTTPTSMKTMDGPHHHHPSSCGGRRRVLFKRKKNSAKKKTGSRRDDNVNLEKKEEEFEERKKVLIDRLESVKFREEELVFQKEKIKKVFANLTAKEIELNNRSKTFQEQNEKEKSELMRREEEVEEREIQVRGLNEKLEKIQKQVMKEKEIWEGRKARLEEKKKMKVKKKKKKDGKKKKKKKKKKMRCEEEVEAELEAINENLEMFQRVDKCCKVM